MVNEMSGRPRLTPKGERTRARIVEEAALIAALTERRIAGAGLDVFDSEPPPSDHPLRKLDNVTLTPHLGYVTQETLAAFYGDMPAAIAAFACGAPVRMINPAALEHARQRLTSIRS